MVFLTCLLSLLSVVLTFVDGLCVVVSVAGPGVIVLFNVSLCCFLLASSYFISYSY